MPTALVRGASGAEGVVVKACYSDMTERDREDFLARHPDCDICGHIARCVDHSHESDLVRGALCGGCNSRIGCLEAALRLPKRRFQSLANDLHRAAARGDDGTLCRILGQRDGADLAYLGLTLREYVDRLHAIQAQLTQRFVYWAPIALGGDRERSWSKQGPFGEAKQRRVGRRLVSRTQGPGLIISLTQEPDDGVDSPTPRGLVTSFHTSVALDRVRELRDAAATDEESAQRMRQVQEAYEVRKEAYLRLVVPIVLSRTLSTEQVRAARAWGPGVGKVPSSPQALRAEVSCGYQPRWVDVAVRIALEDLGEDLPDPGWSRFTRARWHWQAVCEHWHSHHRAEK